jgi:hypothetical protein
METAYEKIKRNCKDKSNFDFYIEESLVLCNIINFGGEEYVCNTCKKTINKMEYKLIKTNEMNEELFEDTLELDVEEDYDYGDDYGDDEDLYIKGVELEDEDGFTDDDDDTKELEETIFNDDIWG